jgi:hypothetical protein
MSEYYYRTRNVCRVADGPNVTVWTAVTLLLGAAFLVTSVVVLLGCVCCRQRKGFQVKSVDYSPNKL